MPKHEFAIMPTPPIQGTRYDCYEPQKYNCLLVNDDYILPLLERLNEVQCYWHTLDRSESGLNYCGITLIPPESLDAIISIVQDHGELSELLALLSKAKSEWKYVIHFGI